MTGKHRRGDPEVDRWVRELILQRVPPGQIMEICGVSRRYVQIRATQMDLRYPKSPGVMHPWRQLNDESVAAYERRRADAQAHGHAGERRVQGGAGSPSL